MLHQKQKPNKVMMLGLTIWGIAMLAQFVNMFHRVAGSVAIDRIMADFDISAATAGILLATYFYVYAIMQFPSGVLADYVGPKKMITLGCLLAGVGSVVFGMSPSLSVLYLGRFLLSLGVSVVYLSVLKLQTYWFASRHFARITSVTGFLAHAGSLVGMTPMALLIITAGWRPAFVLLGLLSFVISLASWLMIKNRPEDIGLPSPNEIEESKFATTVSVPIRDSVTSDFRKRLSIVLKNRRIWPPCLIAASSYGTLLLFQGAWGVPYFMQVYNMTRDSAANFVILMTVGAMVGIVTITYISDRLQRRRLPAIFCSLIYLSLWIILALWNGGKPPIIALYPICFFLGFFASIQALTHASAKEAVPSPIAGMALGVVNMSIFLFAAILQIVFGYLLDLGWQGAMLQGARLYPLEAFQSGLILVAFAASTYVIGALLLRETQRHELSPKRI